MTTQENNITRLVEKGIIAVDLPTMGGVIVVNGLEIDQRCYYNGRGAKYNKNINHEKVIVKITGKELAKAMRHYKMHLKIRALCKIANTKNARKGYDPYFVGTNQHTMTVARRLHFPEMKEISRTKIL